MVQISKFLVERTEWRGFCYFKNKCFDFVVSGFALFLEWGIEEGIWDYILEHLLWSYGDVCWAFYCPNWVLETIS